MIDTELSEEISRRIVRVEIESASKKGPANKKPAIIASEGNSDWLWQGAPRWGQPATKSVQEASGNSCPIGAFEDIVVKTWNGVRINVLPFLGR